MVLMLVGVTFAIEDPTHWCLVVCPPDAGDGDEVTVVAYDENDEWIDLRDMENVSFSFGDEGEDGGVDLGWGLDVSSGNGVFTITQDMLDSESFTSWIYPKFSSVLVLAHPEWEAPFDSAAEAVAAGGSCEVKRCGEEPAITVDPNNIYEPQDLGPPIGPPETGPTVDVLSVSLTWQPGEGVGYPAFTATVKVDPNSGDGKHEDFIFPDSVAGDGSVTLIFDETDWSVQQEVKVEAVEDLDREGDESYPIELTVTINIADPNFGNPTPVVVESSVTVIDNDVPVVLASPDPIEISENDPCTCVDLEIKLSHEPTHDVYVRVEPFEWAFEEPAMAYLDPPLGEADDPNKLKFTTVNWNVEQTITVCPIDDDELREAWYEWIEGQIYFNVFSEDVRYLPPWLNPDGSEVVQDPCTPKEEESNGEADQEMFSVVLVQDNECGAIGFAPQDYNEDCTVGLADFVDIYTQWTMCTEPYDRADQFGPGVPSLPPLCDALWNLVE